MFPSEFQPQGQPAAAVSPQASPAAAAPAPAPAVGDAAAPAAAVGVTAPVPGEVVRYPTWDAYASPARDRDQLVLITSGPDPVTGAVGGVVLGYADAIQASFRPEDLNPA